MREMRLSGSMSGNRKQSHAFLSWTSAMESTGVYWIAPHEILEAQGFKMLLVDTRQLARVPGRDKKTDPTGCECAVRSGRRKPCACCGRWCEIRRT